MGHSISSSLRAALVCSVTMFVLIACGSESDSTFNDGTLNDQEAGTPPSAPFVPPNPDGGGLVQPELCKKLTCADQNIKCGPAGDGCGGIIQDCGTCAPGERCGGPNALSQCVQPQTGTGCVPKSCQDQGVECGQAGDGCGGVLTCTPPGGANGQCPAGYQCGSTASPSKCVEAIPTGPDGGACVPKTKAEYNAEGKDCGQQTNNCGGFVDLGNCNSAAGEFCGGGGPSKCGKGAGGTCTPRQCNHPLNQGKCGPQPDGCGGVTPVSCGSCTFPQVCGGSGVPSVCGGGTPPGPDGGACVPKSTCGPGECGSIANGCGGVLDCGNNCAAGTICGGDGTPNVCGAPNCVPAAACPAGMNCGSYSDGCGGLIQCGASGGGCPAPQICGGSGQSNVCGGGVTGDGGAPCVPKTTATACGAKSCGPVADGCGGLVNCGTCTSPEICGANNSPNVCGGGNQCTKKTIADCPANGCGPIADGCGGVVQCGTCVGGAVCGGGGTPNVCSTGSGAPCTGFCLNQVTTCGASPTTITGKIYAPNATLPLPDALIYVPNGAATTPYGVTPITSGVSGGSCDQCNQTASGSPLVSTTSNSDGSFTLSNVPAGVPFPIVIQLGKWRRMVTIPAVTQCTSVALTAQQTRLPTRQNEGQNGVDNIPFVAISTGKVDGLECGFRKLGLEDTQFGNPTGFTNSRGRIRFYRDDDGRGSRIDDNTPDQEDSLTNSQTNIDQYDAVVFGCAGTDHGHTQTRRDRVRAYADKGGRVFATHFEYTWIQDDATWAQTGTWDQTNSRNSDSQPGKVWPGQIDTSAGKRFTFSQWLNAPNVTALTGTNPPRVDIVEARNNVDRPLASGAEEWITYYNDPAAPATAVLHYTFNTPWGAAAANQCGRVLFSDFHVSIGSTGDSVFPAHCNTNGGQLTNQEKVLAFFLFDLTSCIQTTPPPTCNPRTCAHPANAGKCGPQSDGCGGTTPDCNPCPNGTTCGGGGVPGECGGPTCTPKTCASYGAQCGSVPDGCGGSVNCPPCPNGTVCGGGGVANQCGAISCTPKTCSQQGIQCGQTGNGCGGIADCPDCPSGQTCGGGGTPNVCGAPACTPLTQCPVGKNCGKIPDNCSGVLDCGPTCPDGMTCGGGGSANVCGAASCTPKTCAQQGAQCGQVSDGCGNVVTCNPCPGGTVCVNNQCVGTTCTPKTCAQQGVACGPTADGCGGLIPNCGDCPPGQGCGAGGVPGQCGAIQCTPRTCNDLGAVCGQVANGCGGLTPICGTCEGNLSCSQGQCLPACTPRTCAQAMANCGFISDGCGGLVDCGNCAPGETCGYGGGPNLCGSGGPK